MIECLSFHAAYGCRHSGACCSTAWNLPFTDEERLRVERLELVRAPFLPGPEAGVSFAARRIDGACVFLDSDSRLCSVHRAAGQQALPLTCRMFPRVVRHDTLGTRVSLSHYCPTAAAMLFGDDHRDQTGSIVDAPASLVAVGELDGLDARDALPPLLRPGVLADVESYRAWESHGVRMLTSPAMAPREALECLDAATREITGWQPGSGELLDVVIRATEVARYEARYERGSSTLDDRTSAAIGRWLAARLFGNWIAYQGRGLATVVAYLYYCLDVFERELARDGNALEAFRRADYLIVHEAESSEIARMLDRRLHGHPSSGSDHRSTSA